MDGPTRTYKLAKEVNNGRLAMLGLFGYFVESKVPGSVPALTALNIVQPYSGEYMLAFSWFDYFDFFLERSQFNAPSTVIKPF